MNGTTVGTLLRVVSVLGVLFVIPTPTPAATKPLDWCEPEAPPAQSTAALPITRTVPEDLSPFSSLSAQATTDAQGLSSSASFDAFLDRMKHDGVAPDSTIEKLKSHTLQEKARLGADVESLTGARSDAEVATLTGQQMQDTARIVREREWLSAYGTRIDPRVVEGILGGSPQTMTASELHDKQAEFANLAGFYAQGSPVAAAGQHPPASAASIDGLMASLPRSDTAQMDPGTATDQGGLGKVSPNTPVVLDKTRQCVRKAQPSDWRPDSNTNALPILFDPLGFPEVGLLLQRLPAQGSQVTFHLCSFVMVRQSYALTAAHCAYILESGGPREISGLRDSHQTLALLPDATPGTRNPTACFISPSASGCRYVVASVTASFVPDGFHWAGGAPVPDQDIAVLQLAFRGAPVIVSASLVFTTPAGPRITIAGYGLTTDTLIAPKGTFQVGWQDINAVTQYGLRWVPTSTGRVSNPCPGDSGGPIFVGDLFGAPHEQHGVAAVVSRIEARSAQEAASPSCLDRPGFGVAVAGYQQWICRVIAGSVASCAG